MSAEAPQNQPQLSNGPVPTHGIEWTPHGSETAPEAESLFRALHGAVRAVPTPSANGFPHIPGYEIERELGHGGMGVVYKARDTKLNRTVALKMIRTADIPSPGQVARFRAEAEAVAAVQHPNVIQVHELCPPGSPLPYFTMEYIAGGSLAQYLNERKIITPTEAALLIAALADGLKAAHDADIVHRDIKPANVLLAQVTSSKGSTGADALGPAASSLSDFCPKVTDFGLAKRLAFDLTRTQELRGTPAYMAPEQAGGGAYVGPAADIYSLGAVLFECLTGRLLFRGDDAFAVVQQVLSTPAPALRDLAPAVPRDLELICLKCLEKEPQHRYPTAAALAADLRRFVDGLPVSVRPIGIPARAYRWARRRPAAAALAAMLFVVPSAAAWAIERINTSAAREAEARALAETSKAREDEATAREELARIARQNKEAEGREMQRARDIAAVRELVALQTVRAASRPPSWARQNRAELLTGVALAGGDARVLGELRTTGAVALLAADLKPLDSVQKNFDASAIATDPKSGLVAIGEYLARAPLKAHVRLIAPATGTLVRELSFTAGAAVDSNNTPVPDSIRALVFSPDGTKLFVGTRNSEVIRFDLDRPGSEPLRWKASARTVEQLEVSPDGKIVYGLCRPERPVFAWDAVTGKLITKLEPSGSAPINSFAVMSGGGLITGDGNELRRWGADHKLVHAAPNDEVWRLAVSNSGVLLVGTRHNLDMHTSADLTPLDRFVTPELRRGIHQDYVRTIAVHPSGAFVATSSGDTDRTLRVWELASGRLIGTVLVKGTGPIAVAWSADGNTLLATGNEHIARWAFQTGSAQQFACVNSPPVAAATFGTGGQIVALTEPVGARRELLLGAAGGPSQAFWFTSRGGNGRAGVALAPAGWVAVTTQTPGIIRWRPSAAVPTPGFTSDIAWCPRFGPDSGDKSAPMWAIVGGSGVHSFDAKGQTRTTWSNWLERNTSGLGSLDALAVGRQVVATGGRSGTVHVLDPQKGSWLFSVPNPGDPVRALAVAPDDQLIAGGTQSGKVRMIRPSDRQELPALSAHADEVTAVCLNHSNELLATSGRDRTVKLWKRVGERFELLFTVPDLAGPVNGLQFHPVDNRLLVQITQERAVRVWDIDKLRAQLGRYRLAW
ncbi:serine/threonine-protein kinase [Gemmata sp. JC673]|uniref:Serine/threonine-protein kinase n=1 Tax=Gemmata algarum TaxID=2975278 RepID=A0ABU5EXY4_9BACT|nr:serine/threonine-protein kinase [Gemmata algarum]MDY3559307.1 serine/threonine-protein kinase [Gemmata algarum]